ncbi:uncharacterized protein [Littorina saxatilis]|uniref:Uncharacterized protein n=1 Tax=Littorina saxatilis TaxID=31220 RepID=A0AAN9BW19_9CAEN
MSQPHPAAREADGGGVGGGSGVGHHHHHHHHHYQHHDQPVSGCEQSVRAAVTTGEKSSGATGVWCGVPVGFSLPSVSCVPPRGSYGSGFNAALVHTDQRGPPRGEGEGEGRAVAGGGRRFSHGLRGRALRGSRPRTTYTAVVDAADIMNTRIYRSVPPRPLSYTFSDVLQASLEPRTSGRDRRSRSKTAPVSTNAPEEYAERFKSRPSTRPAVIDFNGNGVKMYNTGSGGGTGVFRRLNNPGFSPVRGKNVAPPTSAATKPRSPVPVPVAQPLTERGTTATSSLHLAPLSKAGSGPDSALSLHTRPYRPPTLPAHAATPKAASSKTPELSCFHGVKSRGKSSGSSHHRVMSGAPDLAARSANSSRHLAQLTTGGGGQPGRSSSSSHRLTTAGQSGDQRLLMAGSYGADPGQWPELSSSKLATLDAPTFSITPLGGFAEQFGRGLPDVLAHSDDYDDLSELPCPKRILPRRDLPWVFRFKVKKEMNALSKIMASKPTSATGSLAATGPMA